MSTKTCSSTLQKWTFEHPIIVWDTETTGLSSVNDRIVEIALMELELPITDEPCKNEDKSYSTLIQPDNNKHPWIGTGITKEQIRVAPNFPQVWPLILAFVNKLCHGRGKPIFVAHNLSFDLRFLQATLLREGLQFPQWDFACSMKDVAKRLWPKGRVSMAALVSRLHIEHSDAHRALGDVHATAKVLVCADQEIRKNQVEKDISPPGSYIYDVLVKAAEALNKENKK